MKENSLQMLDSLKMHFNDQLNSMACATSHLLKNLPEMARLSASVNLRLAFEEALEETETQLARIHEVYNNFEITQSDENCEGIKGIIEEAYAAVKKTEEKSFKRDMALLFYAQIIEYTEIASYTILKVIAAKLGYDEAKILLNESLSEAKDNKKLFQLLSSEYMLKTS